MKFQVLPILQQHCMVCMQAACLCHCNEAADRHSHMSCCTGRFSVKPTFFLPPVDVVLQDTNGDILCTMPMGSDSVVHPNFFFHASSLFQNYPSEKLEDCRAILHKATAVGFQAFTTTSFCVENLQLLTSNVVTGASRQNAALQAAPTMHAIPCHAMPCPCPALHALLCMSCCAYTVMHRRPCPVLLLPALLCMPFYTCPAAHALLCIPCPALPCLPCYASHALPCPALPYPALPCPAMHDMKLQKPVQWGTAGCCDVDCSCTAESTASLWM